MRAVGAEIGYDEIFSCVGIWGINRDEKPKDQRQPGPG